MKQWTANGRKGRGGGIGLKATAVVAIGSMTMVGVPAPAPQRAGREGVENAVVARMLKDLGCPTGQGYLYTRPLPGADMGSWLADHARRARSSVVVALGAGRAQR